MTRVWLVTGASRGIGAGIVRALLAAGEKVVATARKAESLRETFSASDRLLCLALDVTKPDQVRRAADAAQKHFGRIDALVNNAGYGQLGHFETISDEQIRDQFETNVFGAMRVTHAVLPIMRAQGKGHIFTISSAIGLISVPGATLYAASKHALEGWMEGLAGEMRAFGIAATLIEPGYFKSDFFSPSSVSYGAVQIPAYEKAEAEARARMQQMGTMSAGGDAEKLGRALITLADMAAPPVRIAAGSGALTVFGMNAEQLTREAEAHAALSRSIDADPA